MQNSTAARVAITAVEVVPVATVVPDGITIGTLGVVPASITMAVAVMRTVIVLLVPVNGDVIPVVINLD